jgi:hypothetical protein
MPSVSVGFQQGPDIFSRQHACGSRVFVHILLISVPESMAFQLHYCSLLQERQEICRLSSVLYLSRLLHLQSDNIVNCASCS